MEGRQLGLSGIVTESALSAAEADAIVDASRTWSYGEVATSVEKYSAALTTVGVTSGDRVGVHLNKSADGFIAMHAVVSVGAVAVPLDPASPGIRLARICEQMDISVVITHAPRLASVRALHELWPLRGIIGVSEPIDGTEVVSPDDLASLEGQSPARVRPDALAYIVTTSGSTGEPKGIAHTHQSGRAYADMTLRTFGVTSRDRISDISPHHFDISTFSLWATPLAGATNVVVNEAYQRLPASHGQLLADESVTIWYAVPFLLQQLVLRGDLGNRNLESLRWIKFGGEVVPAGIISSMMDHCPNARFVNVFGPAETNAVSLAFFDRPPDPARPLSVGFPVDHSEIRLIDPAEDTPLAEHLVSPGTVGEMWAGTPQLMVGYWGRDDVNEAVLKTVDGVCFYRTGDLVSANDDGELAFHGRVDHQVKVRGFRIELEGIEVDLESLVQRTKSAESVVVSVAREDSGEDKIVAGILGANSDFDAREFLSAAASIVPAYAVPTHTVHLDTAAFTGSGKLDRKTLRARAVALANNAVEEVT